MPVNKMISMGATMAVSFALTAGLLMWQQGSFPTLTTGPLPPAVPEAAHPASPLAAYGPPQVTLARAPATDAMPAPAPASVQPASEIDQIARNAPLRDVYGNLTGIRVFPGHDVEQFYRSGLKGGDLIVAINGTSLDDSPASKQLWSQLSTGSVVTVVRGGKRQDLTLNTAP